MGRRINLSRERVQPLKERIRKRDEDAKASCLTNLTSELAARKCYLVPTPAKEVAKVVRMDSGYTFTEYKSLAKLSVKLDRGRGAFRMETLPDIFEVTEIIYSGVGIEDLEDET